MFWSDYDNHANRAYCAVLLALSMLGFLIVIAFEFILSLGRVSRNDPGMRERVRLHRRATDVKLKKV